MNSSFDHDIFFSYSNEDIDKIRGLARTLNDHGVTTFVADDDLRTERRGTEGWESALLSYMTDCRFFAIYCSWSAINSDWVQREAEAFYENVYSSDERRKMFVLVPSGTKAGTVPDLLKKFLQSRSERGFIRDVLAAVLEFLKAERNEVRKTLEGRVNLLERERDEAREKVREAFDHYGHKRFWEPLSRNRDLHIFTCGREAEFTPKEGRGPGGRTNIDRWDYQTVLEITHFFAEHYPATRVTIEDPVPKLSANDLEGAQVGHRVANLMRQLEDKDCVIVGSPDVSDFGEIVLAELHGIQAFGKERQKQRGFAIIKREMKAPSSTYWFKREEEVEGVAWIEEERYFEVLEDAGTGLTYGMLVVCNNPFSHSNERNKIIILAGFTGVATYGIAKLLTSRECLDEFFEIDQSYGTLDTNFEALVGVRYLYEPLARDRDSRMIDMKNRISIEAIVEIPRRA